MLNPEALAQRVSQLEQQLRAVNMLLRQRLGNDPSTNFNPNLPQSPLVGGTLTVGVLPQQAALNPVTGIFNFVDGLSTLLMRPGYISLTNSANNGNVSLSAVGGVGNLLVSDGVASPRINAIVGGNPSIWVANGSVGLTNSYVVGGRTLTFTCGLLTGII